MSEVHYCEREQGNTITIMEELGKFVSMLLWVATGVILIPFIIVTAVFYPMWEKWGSEF